LVLKEFSRLDYRGLAEHLADHPDLCRLIALKVVPHFTTFQKAAQRLLAAVPGRRMFDAVLEQALKHRVRKRRVRLAAIDGTGMESRHVSRYFTKRQADGNPDGDRTYAHYPKVVFLVDCDSHLILSAVPGRGPATDLVQFGKALSQAVRRAPIGTLLADADFDAEWVHVSARSHGIRTIIPPTRGRPSEKPPAGRWRRVMKHRFARLKRKYGQRWQVETVNSMIKRLLGSALRARVEANQFREIILRAITHNVMIIRIQVFYRAAPTPIVFHPTATSGRAGGRRDAASQSGAALSPDEINRDCRVSHRDRGQKLSGPVFDVKRVTVLGITGIVIRPRACVPAGHGLTEHDGGELG
jgi:hypothetical protein